MGFELTTDQRHEKMFFVSLSFQYICVFRICTLKQINIIIIINLVLFNVVALRFQIFGFLNMIVWGGNIWFLYKETKWFSDSPDNNPPQQQQQGSPESPQQRI